MPLLGAAKTVQPGFAQWAADWRSGPRWSILSVLSPVHPFASSRHFPSRGNEKIGGTGYCVTYDTDSQSRNVLASPLGEEGHEVAKGVQANWIHRGAPRPANPVTCFPPGKVVAPATKGGMHFLERSEVGLFSDARRAVVWFSLPQAAYKTPL